MQTPQIFKGQLDKTKIHGNTMYVLIAIIGEQDLWFKGFLTEASCSALALLIHADWWACVPVST
jgi:hypothetical protein